MLVTMLVITLLGSYMLTGHTGTEPGNLLWERSFLRPTLPGSRRGKRRVKLKKATTLPFQFLRGRTSSQPGQRQLKAPTPQRLLIGDTYDGPTSCFKYQCGDHVFVSLGGLLVTCPIHLNHYLSIQKRKIHYSSGRREWVLDSVPLPHSGHLGLERFFGGRLVLIQVEPVFKVAHVWGTGLVTILHPDEEARVRRDMPLPAHAIVRSPGGRLPIARYLPASDKPDPRIRLLQYQAGWVPGRPDKG